MSSAGISKIAPISAFETIHSPSEISLCSCLGAQPEYPENAATFASGLLEISSIAFCVVVPKEKLPPHSHSPPREQTAMLTVSLPTGPPSNISTSSNGVDSNSADISPSFLPPGLFMAIPKAPSSLSSKSSTTDSSKKSPECDGDDIRKLQEMSS